MKFLEVLTALYVGLKPCQHDFLLYCQAGVKRVHLLDGTIDGVLSLELTTRDGKGTMVARY